MSTILRDLHDARLMLSAMREQAQRNGNRGRMPAIIAALASVEIAMRTANERQRPTYVPRPPRQGYAPTALQPMDTMLSETLLATIEAPL